ncbi:MAG: thioredoxin family protein [Microscillaceae bacterium]|jgi:thiol-disulfide isomerase/thioredoxin|nr:thioredoxin family protein [Microscillaceae bacterium]
MKKILFSVLLVLTCLINLAHAQIKFSKESWEKILATAQKENKLIFVDVYATWCGPCKWMDANVFTNKVVSEKFNAFFVNYKADAEGSGMNVAQKYNVNVYPTFMFIDPQGNVVYRVEGSKPADQFIEDAKTALRSTKNGNIYLLYEDAYNKGNRQSQFIADYCKLRNFYHLNNHEIVETYLAKLPNDSLNAPLNQQIIIHNCRQMSGKAFEYILNHHTEKRFANVLEIILNQSFKEAVAQKDEEALIQMSQVYEKIKTPEEASHIIHNQYLQFYFDTKAFKKFISYAENYAENHLLVQYKTADDTKQKSLQDNLLQLSFLYFSGIKDERALQKAVGWIEEVNKINPNPQLLSNQAHLHYKLKQYDQAKTLQTQALQMLRTNNENEQTIQRYEETLQKIEKKKL